MNKYSVAISKAKNYSMDEVNSAIDDLLMKLGYDIDNPFSGFIKPGMTVFIKPNWVASSWRKSCNHIDDIYSVITHPSVIEAVADRVAIALQGKGEIIIGDNPSIDANFDELMRLTEIKALEKKYDVDCKVLDLRPLVCKDLKYYGKKDKMCSQLGDPLGEVEVNLGNKSLLASVDPTLFRGVFNEREETIKSHTGSKQLYTYSRSLYEADVYISIPKLKTHQKVGTTLNLKGLVGSITRKNQLVHWRLGSPETGGDEYPNKKSLQIGKKAKVTHRGAWPGNDTIWRMVVDLYQGMLQKERKYFTIIDGIIAGEGQGPFCPNSKNANVLLASDNLLIADIVATRLMGINPLEIKYLNYFIDKMPLKCDDINIYSDMIKINNDNFFNDNDKYLDFKVPQIWEKIKI
ncbi:DUF362 domain-containing protein [Clostridium botulinum]|uniref:DUF362 domain-containing protein n=1 Tax=Clostridium botulinum TaxID=1491 RepID=UPI001375D8C2|nr:DUF362 domain-containing protein [Clostridium botulinum]MCC5419096.1 DUF362 domain-containing protein [Clostridium botulinum]NCI21804.1 DUF362 domain-containing protein [Clostridium botulinum]NCI37687.1 DUF362 domain-containing protein [Clostridium botulinum]NCI74190.1 DUF362 domain-containing protein [Clostridium botulinum]NDI38923.1 DUF362 domain-containing protein [Clostridium botulinum]